MAGLVSFGVPLLFVRRKRDTGSSMPKKSAEPHVFSQPRPIKYMNQVHRLHRDGTPACLADPGDPASATNNRTEPVARWSIFMPRRQPVISDRTPGLLFKWGLLWSINCDAWRSGTSMLPCPGSTPVSIIKVHLLEGRAGTSHRCTGPPLRPIHSRTPSRAYLRNPISTLPPSRRTCNGLVWVKALMGSGWVSIVTAYVPAS